MTELKRLKRVELRDVWPNEATHFTPWLARPENLELLGETLGIELEIRSNSRSVGNFIADIVCVDSLNNTVLIENQLEPTDHKHIGQVLTYAAGINANTIIWVAGRFRDEHRAAVDWLNRFTTDPVSVFAIEIELWSIGNCGPAPKFNVVAKPNDWGGPLPPPDPLTDYWSGLREHMQEHPGNIKLQAPSSTPFSDGSIGKAGFKLRVTVSMMKRRIRVALLIYGSDAAAYGNLLFDQRADINSALKEQADWQLPPETKTTRISVELPDCDASRRGDWPRQFEWIANTLTDFDSAFRHRIQDLDPADYIPDDVDQDDDPAS